MMTLGSIRELVLAVALFFNPFGYNELFAYIMSLTGSYWTTACFFYVLSGILFGVYFLLKFKEKGCTITKGAPGGAKGATS